MENTNKMQRVTYLSTLFTGDKLLPLRMGHHMVPQPVLPDHLLAADLAHVLLPLHVHHLTVNLEQL